MTLANEFNSTLAISDIESEVEAIIDDAWNYTKSEYLELIEGDNIRPPTFDLDFNLDNITGFTDVHVQLEFDDLELCFDFDTKLQGGTWKINFFTSETPAGFDVPDLDLEVGAVFSVDLILIADTDIDIGSGIHIKLDDGVMLDLQMFKNDVSSIEV